jgi:hypothetical protein
MEMCSLASNKTREKIPKMESIKYSLTGRSNKRNLKENRKRITRQHTANMAIGGRKKTIDFSYPRSGFPFSSRTPNGTRDNSDAERPKVSLKFHLFGGF